MCLRLLLCQSSPFVSTRIFGSDLSFQANLHRRFVHLLLDPNTAQSRLLMLNMLVPDHHARVTESIYCEPKVLSERQQASNPSLEKGNILLELHRYICKITILRDVCLLLKPEYA